MQSVHTFKQAYSQAPWRKQIQIAGTFLLVVVAIWVVAIIYTDVTARATTYGREIQEMQVHPAGLLSVTDPEPKTTPKYSIEELERINSDLQTRFAYLTSDTVMAERARKLGYEPVAYDNIIYIKVPGYIAPTTAVVAPPPGPVVSTGLVIEPAFKESLIDWLKEQALQVAQILKGEQP